MPQLNPAPWFMIMLFSWAVFLTLIPPKVINHSFPNDPSFEATETTKPQPWSWPWS